MWCSSIGTLRFRASLAWFTQQVRGVAATLLRLHHDQLAIGRACGVFSSRMIWPSYSQPLAPSTCCDAIPGRLEHPFVEADDESLHGSAPPHSGGSLKSLVGPSLRRQALPAAISASEPMCRRILCSAISRILVGQVDATHSLHLQSLNSGQRR